MEGMLKGRAEDDKAAVCVCVGVRVCCTGAHRSVTCGPSRGGSMLPAPRRQCCTMARLCSSSSLKREGKVEVEGKRGGGVMWVP